MGLVAQSISSPKKGTGKPKFSLLSEGGANATLRKTLRGDKENTEVGLFIFRYPD